MSYIFFNEEWNYENETKPPRENTFIINPNIHSVDK